MLIDMGAPTKCPNASENDAPPKAAATANVMNPSPSRSGASIAVSQKRCFYKLLAKGLGPATYFVGKRRYVSAKSDAAWLAAREAEAREAEAA